MSKELFKNFDWKNGTFNQEQLDYLNTYTNIQIDNLLSGTTNESLAENHLLELIDESLPTLKGKKIVWRDSPEDAVKYVRDSVWASVGDSVRDSVGASVGASVWASVGDSVRDSVDSWRWSDNYFLKFFSENMEENVIEKWCLLAEQTTGSIITNTEIILIRKPIRLVRSSEGRLSYDHGKAVEWADGTGYYYLDGVELPEDTYNRIVKNETTADDLLSGNLNSDQRAVVLRYLKPELLIKQLDAELIDTGESGTKLYEVKDFGKKVSKQAGMDDDIENSTEYFILMKHPSLETYYIEWVNPDTVKENKSADYCQAVAFGQTVASIYQEAIKA